MIVQEISYFLMVDNILCQGIDRFIIPLGGDGLLRMQDTAAGVGLFRQGQRRHSFLMLLVQTQEL